MDHKQIGFDAADWIDLARDSDQWRSLLNMIFVFHKRWEIS